MNDDEIKAEEAACHDNLKAQIVGVLYLAHRQNIPYLAVWDIAPQCDLDLEVRPFGGCGVPGEGDDALKALVKDGTIEELPDLRCRYRLANVAEIDQRLASAEARIEALQQQAAALAREAGLTAQQLRQAAKMLDYTKTVVGIRTELAEELAVVFEQAAARLEAAESEASDG